MDCDESGWGLESLRRLNPFIETGTGYEKWAEKGSKEIVGLGGQDTVGGRRGGGRMKKEGGKVP